MIHQKGFIHDDISQSQVICKLGGYLVLWEFDYLYFTSLMNIVLDKE